MTSFLNRIFEFRQPASWRTVFMPFIALSFLSGSLATGFDDRLLDDRLYHGRCLTTGFDDRLLGDRLLATGFWRQALTTGLTTGFDDRLFSHSFYDRLRTGFLRQHIDRLLDDRFLRQASWPRLFNR
jgi:hypothetical protein